MMAGRQLLLQPTTTGGARLAHGLVAVFGVLYGVVVSFIADWMLFHGATMDLVVPFFVDKLIKWMHLGEEVSQQDRHQFLLDIQETRAGKHLDVYFDLDFDVNFAFAFCFASTFQTFLLYMIRVRGQHSCFL